MRWLRTRNVTILGPSEGRVDRRLAAGRHRERDIARAIRPDERRARRRRIVEIADRGQRLVRDAHQLGRGARLVERVGDDERHPVADAAHAALRQERPFRRIGLGAARMLRQIEGHDAAKPFGGRVVPGQDAQHAGHGPRLGRIDAGNPRMGMGRQDERAPCHPRQHDVADIVPLAGEEAVILDSPHALSDAAFRHALPIA